MTDRDYLLRAVCADPAADTPRLVFADYLDEQGSEADRARARFVRLQVEAERLPHGGRRSKLNMDADAIWWRHRRDFDRDLDAAFDPDGYGPRHIDAVRWEWARGFANVISIPLHRLIADPARVATTAPVQRVSIYRMSMETFRGGRHGWYAADLPDGLFACLPGEVVRFRSGRPAKVYGGISLARTAMEAAALSYARQCAGFPETEPLLCPFA